MLLFKKRNLVLAAAAIVTPLYMVAAETNAKPADPMAGYNIPLMALIGLMLILLYFIGMLANTLRVLSEVLKEKFRKERKEGAGAAVKALIALALLSCTALASNAAEAASAATKYIIGIPENDYYLLVGVIGFELLIILALSVFITILSNTIRGRLQVSIVKPVVKKSWFWDDFNAAVPIEKEHDLLLDHNYDGIQELDNSLPPWWKYGFILTIFVGIIYLYRYQVSGDGPSQEEEYAAEMQKGEEDKAAYLVKAGNSVDETNVTLLTDAGSIGEGHELFSKNCVACHLADGGGSVGPNLTDEYWIHGGGIKDVFKTLKYGWQEKGMKSWKDDFSPKQLQEIASFVKSLKGTKPLTPKAPQGELYIDASAPAKDSGKASVVAKDSTATAKTTK